MTIEGERPSVNSELAAFPPEHPFLASPVFVGAWHPLVQKIKVRRETPQDFIASRAKGRTVLVRNQVMDSKELPRWAQPAQDGAHIIVAAIGINRAIAGVLEEPIELPRRRVRQKIRDVVGC